MLVLIGPEFDGSSDAYGRLARVTGLVAYDLKARVRPGAWGLVKVLGDDLQAEDLAARLAIAGFRPLLVARQVAHDPERRIVHAKGVVLAENGFVLELADQELSLEYGAIACIVRGEVHPGRAVSRGAVGASSGASFRAVSASTVEPVSTREAQSPFETYQAADIHFLTVGWFARIDARVVGTNGEVSVRALDTLVDELARRAGVRVDRSVRTSSLASFAEQAVSLRTPPPEPVGREHRREHPDERFDSYSRLVGEAERRSRLAAQPGEAAQPV